VIDNATIFVSLEGIIDFSQEAARLKKEIGQGGQRTDGRHKKLGNEDFLSKAPEDGGGNKVKSQHAAIRKNKALETHLERIEALAS
jgi:valyl-tRNA synthetase